MLKLAQGFLKFHLICTSRLEWKEKKNSWNSLYDSEKLVYPCSSSLLSFWNQID